MSTIPDYQQRVVDERDALESKLNKLYAFQRTEAYEALDPNPRSLLCRQAYYMGEYLITLNARIRLFKQ